jgi:hypothetical protein
MAAKEFVDFAEAIEYYILTRNKESITKVSIRLEEMIKDEIKEEVMKQRMKKDTLFQRYTVELGILKYNILSGLVVLLFIGVVLMNPPQIMNEGMNEAMNKREFAW